MSTETPRTDAVLHTAISEEELIEALLALAREFERDLAAAQERVKELESIAAMLDAVVQGAQEEFVRVPYGASREDVAAINEWHKLAREARALLEPKP